MAVPESTEGNVARQERDEVAGPGQDRRVGSLCKTSLAVGVLDHLDGRSRDLAPESRLAVVSYVARWGAHSCASPESKAVSRDMIRPLAVHGSTIREQ